MSKSELARVMLNTLSSPNETDSNGEEANIVDGLFFVGRNIRWAGEDIAKALNNLAAAMRSSSQRGEQP